jgi:bla regulator protein BlaR1
MNAFGSSLADHLWQSTLFALVAGLLTLTLRKNRARVRHGIWLAASCKFLVPLSLLIALGGRIEWKRAPVEFGVSVVMAQVSQPFTGGSAPLLVTEARERSLLPVVLWSIWACGLIGISSAWWVRWRRIRAAVGAGSAVHLEVPVKVVSSPTLLEPGVFGVFRPVLMLPEGIFGRLNAAQLSAVLEHELCHVRHRDNLVAAIHMFVETVFWFHPLVWWIGKRMVEERELGCDEEVLSRGGEARVYAEAILNVCKLYVESPLECVAGVTGADLKKRIEAIMSGRFAVRLSFAKKGALAGAGMVVLALPIVAGMMNAPGVRARLTDAWIAPAVKMPGPPFAVKAPVPQKAAVAEQRVVPPAELQRSAPVAFEVVSIKPADPAGRAVRADGGPGTKDPELFTCENYSLKALVSMAYAIPYYRVVAAYWAEEIHFTISARVSAGATKEQFLLMLQNMLRERFKMTVHRETKEMKMYDLVVAKDGPRLKPAAEEVPAAAEPVKSEPDVSRLDSKKEFLGKDGYPVLGEGWSMAMGYGRARILYPRQTLEWFTEFISSQVNSPVKDTTGLTGKYDFAMYWSTEEGSTTRAGIASEPRPTLFDAVQSQLGLKLEQKKGPVEIVVVDYSERVPTGN